MSVNGVYGTSVGSLVTPQDVDIFYSYSETRANDDVTRTSFKKLDSNLLVQSTSESSNDYYDNVLEGLYNLKLPMNVFNKKGFYTIYIKPKEYKAVIQDVGSLSSYPDVKGVIISSENSSNDSYLNELLKENNSLVGYRIIYFDDKSRQSYYRIITSNNKCEPIVQNIQDSNKKSITYRYNESSSSMFITVTPSASTTAMKANSSPYIGVPMQSVSIVNTKFEPVMIELEMVENDFDTISTMLEGSQLRDLDNGLITTFNKKNEIYAQHEVYTLKDEFTSTPVFEVKKNKTESIDFSQTIEDK
ncbi:MAG: hypothetical protein IKT40_07515 [Bacilli bacterium]|nr:hypothetical protein [Bacilli bacterium]